MYHLPALIALWDYRRADRISPPTASGSALALCGSQLLHWHAQAEKEEARVVRASSFLENHMKIKLLACIAKLLGVQFHVGGLPYGADYHRRDELPRWSDDSQDAMRSKPGR